MTFSSASHNWVLWSAMVFLSATSPCSAFLQASSNRTFAFSAMALYVVTSSSSFCIAVAPSTSVCVPTDSKQALGEVCVALAVVAGGASVYVVCFEEGGGRAIVEVIAQSCCGNCTCCVSVFCQSSVAILTC